MMIKHLARLLHYALPFRRQWGVILLATIVGSLMTLLQPWPIKFLVDHVLQQRELPDAAREWLAPLAGSRVALLGLIVAAGLIVFIINALSDVLLTRAWTRVGQGMVWKLAGDLYARLQRRSLAFHSRNRVGDSIARITGDSWAVHTLVDTLLFSPATALLMLSMMLVVMFRMDVPLTLIALGIAPLMAGGAWMLSGPVGALAKARREIDSRMQSHVQQTLAGIPVVQAFSREKVEHQRFNAIAQSALHTHRRAAILEGANELVSGLIITLGTGVVLLIGGQRVLEGGLTVGGLLVFLGYLTTLQTQMKVLASAYTGVYALRASVDRVMQVLELEPEVRDAPDARQMNRADGRVRLENVTFGYEPQHPVLNNVSIDARPGQVVAIVGPTGAGKSTLVSLIPRLMDPWSGHVTIDGIDVRDIRVGDVRRNVALVLQESMLFPISIADNIAYGRPGATRPQIIAAARTANIHDFIERLPEGYDTIIGERGATLSGGERQRIAIARALLMDAPILILDEPTSNLDPNTESLLLDALDRLMAGRTTFIIAHRLSTIRRANCIIVLENGQVVESGAHESLLAARGLYARLHEIQIGRSKPREEVLA